MKAQIMILEGRVRVWFIGLHDTADEDDSASDYALLVVFYKPKRLQGR